MAYVRQTQIDNGTVYDIAALAIFDGTNSYKTWTDITNLVSTGFQLIKCTEAGNTPKGITWTSGSVTVTGTLEANDAEAAIYFVPDHTQTGKDIYDEYIAVGETGSKTWEIIGTTDAELENLVSKGTYNGTAAVSYSKATVTDTATPSMTGSSTFTGTTASLSLDSGSTKFLKTASLSPVTVTVNHVTGAALASAPSFTGDTATIQVSGNVVSDIALTPTTTRIVGSLSASPSFTGTTATFGSAVSGLSGSVETAVNLTDGTPFTATRVTNFTGGSASYTSPTLTGNKPTTVTVDGASNQILHIFTGTTASLNNGSFSFTPATLTRTTVTITPIANAALASGTVSLSGGTVTITYQPAGSVSKPNVNISTSTSSGTTVMTGLGYTITQGSVTLEGEYQPTGSVSKPNVNLTSSSKTVLGDTSSVSTSNGTVTVTGSYQPEGSVSTTISGGAHTHSISTYTSTTANGSTTITFS